MVNNKSFAVCVMAYLYSMYNNKGYRRKICIFLLIKWWRRWGCGGLNRYKGGHEGVLIEI